MELNSNDVEELLGAWALDALDPDEAAMVDAVLADDDELSERARRLRSVADSLADRAAVPPPTALRDVVMQAARNAPRVPIAATDSIDLFANQVEALSELLGNLDDDVWAQRAAPYEWSVHGLVAHLLVIERYTAGQLGMVEPTRGNHAAHLATGADEIASELGRSPAETVSAWSAAATALVEWLRTGERAPDDPVELHGWPFRTSTLLVARAFEVWTHADDIRRAIGRPVAAPADADLRSMSRFSVTSLPLLLPLVAPDERFGGARVVLTGDGGGTYDLGDTGADATVVVLDIVDYCRHAARRIERADLGVTIDGDPAVADRLLAAAQVFAV